MKILLLTNVGDDKTGHVCKKMQYSFNISTTFFNEESESKAHIVIELRNHEQVDQLTKSIFKGEVTPFLAYILLSFWGEQAVQRLSSFDPKCPPIMTNDFYKIIKDFKKSLEEKTHPQHQS